jgi:hypothetical protein
VKWRVREVRAKYSISGLVGGFTNDYAAPDGTEWTKEISAEEAATNLMLGLTPTPK